MLVLLRPVGRSFWLREDLEGRRVHSGIPFLLPALSGLLNDSKIEVDLEILPTIQIMTSRGACYCCTMSSEEEPRDFIFLKSRRRARSDDEMIEMMMMNPPQFGPRGGDNVRRDELRLPDRMSYFCLYNPVAFQDYKSTLVIAFAVLPAILLLSSSLDELDKVGTDERSSRESISVGFCAALSFVLLETLTERCPPCQSSDYVPSTCKQKVTQLVRLNAHRTHRCSPLFLALALLGDDDNLTLDEAKVTALCRSKVEQGDGAW